MPFSNLIGNELAKAALRRMADQHSVPNTLLFSGPDGVGKSLFAQALAECLMNTSLVNPHPDLHIYKPEGKSAIHTMDSIRQLIDEVALPPFQAPVKVFILHDAHQMLPYSSNALLKTLEEPSFHSYFILLTSNPDSMLPTLISRCRKVPFFPISQPLIEILVKQKWQKSPEMARRIAFLSHGSLAKAEQLTSDHQIAWRSPLLEILTLHLPDEYPQFLKLALEIEEHCTSEEDSEEDAHVQTDDLFEEIAAWYRDLQLLKEGIAPEYLYHLDSFERLKTALSRPIPHLEKVLEHMAKCRLALQRNVKLRTVLEHFFMNLV